MVCDVAGWPLAIMLNAGQAHETQAFEPLMESVSVKSPRRPAKRRPWRLAGDNGNSSKAIRSSLQSHHIEAVISHRRHETGATQDFEPPPIVGAAGSRELLVA